MNYISGMNTYNVTETIEALGCSQTRLAEILGVTRPRISQKVKADKLDGKIKIPLEWAGKLHAEGLLSGHVTRPDIFGARK